MKQPKQARLNEVRLKLAERGITEQDVADAIAWARAAEPTDDELAATRSLLQQYQAPARKTPQD
jgi:SOS response regulatory protein OraA/RecX